MSTAKLPLGYRRVQYILNSNNTYINTGIYLSSDDHVIFEYDASMASGAGNRYLFGDDTTTGKRFYALAYYSGSASPRFGYAAISTRYLTSGRIEVLNHVWHFGGTEDTYDGTYNGNVQNFVCTQPCCLFNNPSKANAKHDFGISHFFVEGKFDGYACINPDGEAGIYDIQSQSFLKSPEGISFVAGPVIEEEGFFQIGDSRRRKIMGNYIPNYLVFKAREDGTFTFTYGATVSEARHESMSYSLDGRNWTTLNNVTGEAVSITSPTIQAGKKIYWKGVGNGLCYDRSVANAAYFSSTGSCDLEGNIMSLLYGDDFASVKEIPKMIAGTTKYSDTPCFYGLFRTMKIVSAKEFLLPATILRPRCYTEMFYNCTSLTEAPQLPATTLVQSCYVSMFTGCTALVKAPVLPAETLVQQCYYQMFYNCTSLNYIKAMFTNSLTVTQALTYWVRNVNGTGTFVKNANATWENTYGVSAIPANFTVVTE